MSRYKLYPEYKDSGVEWLGTLPSNWNIKRLGQFFEERREKVSDEDFPPLSVTQNGIVPQLENAAKTDAGDNRKLVLKKDFVINSRSDRKGSSGVSLLDGSVSLISIVLTPRNIVPSYVNHLLRSYPFQEEFYRFGKGIHADLWSTNSSEMKNILMPDIPEDEQLQIANFLDHETVKIDTLIEKQRQLIKLLKEKRQAVISHAVTKGLNPDAPMKDSGVEWLGDVPEHWGTGRFVYQLDLLLDGTHFSPESYPEGDYLYITAKNIKEDGFDFSNISYISKIDHETIYSRCSVKKGDVLYIKDGATAGVAMVNHLEEPFSMLSSVALIRPNLQKLHSQYICYLLNASIFKNEMLNRLNGGAMTRFTVDAISHFPFIIPPLSDQLEICENLDKVNEKYKKIIKNADKQILLLQERRTALISAAVTGKIDVRDWKKPGDIV